MNIHSHCIIFRSRFLAIVAMGLLAACSENKEPFAQDPAPEVAVITLAAQKISLQTELTGRVSALRVADVRPQVAGIIEKRLFEEGSNIKAGDVLFHINDASYAAQVAQAKANLAIAKASLVNLQLIAERYQKLIQTNNISRHDMETASANYQQGLAQVAANEAALQKATIDWERTRIRAPISGRIGRSLVTEGALVSAEQTNALAKIQQLDSVYVDIVQSSEQLTQRKLLQLHQDHTGVSVILENGQIYQHAGVLKFIDSSVDSETGMVALRAQFPNPEGLLLPGMFVRAKVEQAVVPNALLVPQQAISYDEKNQPIAWVLNSQQQAEQRVVEVMGNQGNQWIVSEGLTAGERIIVEGLLRIKPGLKVSPVDWNKQSALALVQTSPAQSQGKP